MQLTGTVLRLRFLASPEQIVPGSVRWLCLGAYRCAPTTNHRRRRRRHGRRGFALRALIRKQGAIADRNYR